jgi:hypothetical protein
VISRPSTISPLAGGRLVRPRHSRYACGAMPASSRARAGHRSGCNSTCRDAFHSAGRRWAEIAVLSGLLTAADLRNGPPEPCTLLTGQRRRSDYPAIGYEGTALTRELGGERNHARFLQARDAVRTTAIGYEETLSATLSASARETPPWSSRSMPKGSSTSAHLDGLTQTSCRIRGQSAMRSQSWPTRRSRCAPSRRVS